MNTKQESKEYDVRGYVRAACWTSAYSAMFGMFAVLCMVEGSAALAVAATIAAIGLALIAVGCAQAAVDHASK